MARLRDSSVFWKLRSQKHTNPSSPVCMRRHWHHQVEQMYMVSFKTEFPSASRMSAHHFEGPCFPRASSKKPYTVADNNDCDGILQRGTVASWNKGNAACAFRTILLLKSQQATYRHTCRIPAGRACTHRLAQCSRLHPPWKNQRRRVKNQGLCLKENEKKLIVSFEVWWFLKQSLDLLNSRWIKFFQFFD